MYSTATERTSAKRVDWWNTGSGTARLCEKARAYVVKRRQRARRDDSQCDTQKQ